MQARPVAGDLIDQPVHVPLGQIAVVAAGVHVEAAEDHLVRVLRRTEDAVPESRRGQADELIRVDFRERGLRALAQKLPVRDVVEVVYAVLLRDVPVTGRGTQLFPGVDVENDAPHIRRAAVYRSYQLSGHDL